MTQTKAELTAAFQKADDEWGAALRRMYGRAACNLRYSTRYNGAKDHPESRLHKLYKARETARVAWEAVAFPHLKPGDAALIPRA